jgi:hypothetical protein
MDERMNGMRSVVDVQKKVIFLSLGRHGMCLMSGSWYLLKCSTILPFIAVTLLITKK